MFADKTSIKEKCVFQVIPGGKSWMQLGFIVWTCLYEKIAFTDLKVFFFRYKIRIATSAGIHNTSHLRNYHTRYSKSIYCSSKWRYYIIKVWHKKM